MHAELAYLFRHALLRDAAYELQLPSDRARLHELSFHLIEQAFGGRAPEPPPLNAVNPPTVEPHSTDTVAAELADHLADAFVHARLNDEARADLRTSLLLYLRRGAEHAERLWHNDIAIQLWLKLATSADAPEAIYRAALMANLKGDLVLVRELASRAIDLLDPDEDLGLRAASLKVRAGANLRLGKSQAAETDYLDAIETCERAGDSASAPEFRASLAGLYHRTGRVDEAERLYLAAKLEFENANRTEQLGVLAANYAILLQETGRVSQAVECYEEALALVRQAQNKPKEASTLSGLAMVLSKQGDMETALTISEQALAIYRQVGNRLGEAVTMTATGGYLRQLGRMQEAEHAYLNSLSMLRELGSLVYQGVALGNIASLFAQTERLAEAEATFTQALGIHRAARNRRSESYTLLNLGTLNRDTGRFTDAIIRYNEAAVIAAELRDDACRFTALCRAAVAHAQSGDRRRALELWHYATTRTDISAPQVMRDQEHKEMQEVLALSDQAPLNPDERAQ